MLKKLILLFLMCATLPALAAPYCGQLFQKSELIPSIGVFVEAQDGSRHILLDSYFTGSHENLLRSFHNSEKGPLARLLWAGEAMVQRRGDGISIGAANETSGFLRMLKNGEISNFVERVDISSASVHQLRQAHDLVDVKNADLREFEASDFRIFSLGKLDGLTARHEIGNHFTISNAIMGMKMRKPGLRIPEEHFESIRILREFVERTVSHSLHNLNPERRRLSFEFIRQSQEILSAKNDLDWAPERLNAFRSLSVELHRMIYRVDKPLMLSQSGL